jgi:hypothetical protein
MSEAIITESPFLIGIGNFGYQSYSEKSQMDLLPFSVIPLA